MGRIEFGNLIKKLRIDNDKTLYDIAQICHTGSGTISRWENGYSAPPDAARIAIINKLKELLNDTSR